MTRKNLLLLILLALPATLGAQNFKGTVFYRDPKGAVEALPFAQVYHIEKETLLECDEHGEFALEIKKKATLVATYVGYSQDTVVVDAGTASANFYLTGANEVEQVVISARQAGLSRLSQVKTEAITAAGLCKMACCNLAESFENSASVSVGYSDAVTGARQIKLLGLSGVYTQMQDEKMPIMRGLASTFGLNYVPGQWLESIQISKGPSSVANDAAGITGQINMEHRKPIDETPLFVNLYGSTDEMFEMNVASALQLNEKWSTIILAHGSMADSYMDHNKDGFRDDPSTRQLNFANRWLYYDPSGLQVRFGFKVVGDNRLGGQMTYNRTDNKGWGSLIDNRLYNGYLKVGLPLRDDQSQSIAFVATFNHYGSDASFGYDTYSGRQDNVFANLLYHNDINDRHSFEVGLTALTDFSTEDYQVRSAPEVSAKVALPYMGRREVEVGPMAEYTWHGGEAMTLVAGVRADYNTYYRKLLFAPRATFRYNVTDDLILRLSAGRAFHSPHLLAHNYGLFTSSRANRHIKIDVPELLPEDAVTFGGNLTWYLPFGYENNTYVSAEYFGSRFLNQLYVDKEMADVGCYIYNTQGSKVFTNTFQLDFSSDLTEHFNLLATLRYTNPKVSRRVTSETDAATQLVTVPMSSLFKAVVNAQYKTNLSKWTFDLTAQLNGPMRLPDYAAAVWGMEQSPVYPMFYAQVTRKFRGLDVYAGVENISGYRQKDAIIAAGTPFSNDFDATVIWGPLMGRKAYIGLRYTLWK